MLKVNDCNMNIFKIRQFQGIMGFIEGPPAKQIPRPPFLFPNLSCPDVHVSS